MLPRHWMLTWTLLAGLGAATLWPLAVPAHAQEKPAPAAGPDKKVIKKGSGQFEEYYELLPPEEGEGDPSPAATGNLDPEGDAGPPAAASSAVKRAPVGAPKGAFGAPVPTPAAKSQPTRQPAPDALPEPGEAVDATLPMEEPAPPAAAQAPGVKKPLPAEADPPIAPAKSKSANVAAPSEPAEAPAAPSGTDFFLAALDQGGSWTKHAKYGDVFVPEAGSDWRPYTAGRWIYDTALGWTWISEEAHGWATYHYGRWSFEKETGWFWIPGTEWAPSWVVWRQGEDAIGWAPLPPAAQFTSKGLSLDAKVIESDAFERAWVFVAPRYFGQQVMRRFIRPIRWNADLVDRTSPMLGYQRKDGVVANRGIAVEDVSRLAGNPPQRMTVAISPDVRFKQPSFRSGEEVKIYRPDERQIADLARKAAKIKQGGAPLSAAAKASTPKATAEGQTAKRFPTPPKAERTETNGSVTESWAKPAAPEKPKPAQDAAPHNAKPAAAKAEQTFAPAPAVQRTETNGAVTETWGDTAAAHKSKPKAETHPAAGEQTSPATPAKKSAASSAASSEPPVKASAGEGSRSESYSVPSAEEAGDAPVPAPAGASGTQTGSTAKPRWDGSGASGGPGLVPGAAP